jgi:hypothetical protein
MSQDDGITELFLGIFFGAGVSFCVLGLAAAILWGIFPDYAPSLLALIETVRLSPGLLRSGETFVGSQGCAPQLALPFKLRLDAPGGLHV